MTPSPLAAPAEESAGPLTAQAKHLLGATWTEPESVGQDGTQQVHRSSCLFSTNTFFKMGKELKQITSHQGHTNIKCL